MDGQPAVGEHRGGADVPARSDHSPRETSARPAHASFASGSTQRNVAEPADEPKCPNVRGELRAPVQCGDFASFSSKPSPQSFGSIRPNPGSTPTRPGNWTLVA